MTTVWIYDNETTSLRAVFESIEAVGPWGWMSALATLAAAIEGDRDTARRRLKSLLSEDLAPLRRPTSMFRAPCACWQSAAALAEDRERAPGCARCSRRCGPTCCRLRRPSSTATSPSGTSASWNCSRAAPDAAVGELRAAVARADSLDLALAEGMDKGGPRHRSAPPRWPGRPRAGTRSAQRRRVIAERYGTDGFSTGRPSSRRVRRSRAAADLPADRRAQRPVRALAARTGRRALAAVVRGRTMRHSSGASPSPAASVRCCGR